MQFQSRHCAPNITRRCQVMAGAQKWSVSSSLIPMFVSARGDLLDLLQAEAMLLKPPKSPKMQRNTYQYPWAPTITPNQVKKKKRKTRFYFGHFFRKEVGHSLMLLRFTSTKMANQLLLVSATYPPDIRLALRLTSPRALLGIGVRELKHCQARTLGNQV